jgi:hypothetical protein
MNRNYEDPAESARWEAAMVRLDEKREPLYAGHPLLGFLEAFANDPGSMWFCDSDARNETVARLFAALREAGWTRSDTDG